MVIRKLDKREHDRTRALYEEVFPEDDQAFVTYYYTWKTKENEIYAAEDENGIHAMVQLNPFSVQYQGRVQRLHYIVAVATQETYRHQGLMRRLLALAEQEMQSRGEPLTFLMPASENIYLPFGYRFFGWQRRGIFAAEEDQEFKNAPTFLTRCWTSGGCPFSTDRSGTKNARHEVAISKADSRNKEPVRAAGRQDFIWQCKAAEEETYEALAQNVNQILQTQFEVYVVRDASYYRRLQAEQRSQGGSVMVMNRPDHENEFIGTFCTACEPDGTLILREVIFSPEQAALFHSALKQFLRGQGRSSVRVEGCQKELLLQEAQEVPLYMGKVPGEGIFEELPKAETVFLNEVV